MARENLWPKGYGEGQKEISDENLILKEMK
jgi:hypothetical protein